MADLGGRRKLGAVALRSGDRLQQLSDGEGRLRRAGRHQRRRLQERCFAASRASVGQQHQGGRRAGRPTLPDCRAASPGNDSAVDPGRAELAGAALALEIRANTHQTRHGGKGIRTSRGCRVLTRKDRKSPARPKPINAEVAPVEREDLANTVSNRSSDKRGVRKVHWQIPVLSHQRSHTR